MTNWKKVKLGDIADVQNGYAFKATDMKTSGIPIIKIKNIQPPNISFDDAEYYEGEINKKLEQFLLKRKDTLISMTGSTLNQISSVVGKVGRFNSDKKALINQRVGKVFSMDVSTLSNDFLYYFIAQPEIQIELATNAGGSANQANISPKNIKDLWIELPSINIQTRIASILSALDEKIELNRQMNITLEQMAQAVFKKYFINDVDEDNLPKGWRFGKVKDIFDISIGRTPPRNQHEWFSENPSDVKWISIKDLGIASTYIFETSEFITNEAVRKFNIPIIPDNTIVLSFKLTVGRVSITTEKMLSNEAIAHFIPKKGMSTSTEFTYLYLKNFDFHSLGNTSSIATAVNSQTIKEMKFLIPSEEVIMEFAKSVSPFFLKIRSNTTENCTLIRTRNLLHPRLMVGVIGIKE